MTPAQRRELTDRQHRHLSIVRQCQLMGVSRSSLYYRPKGTLLGDLSLMQAWTASTWKPLSSLSQ